MTTQPIRVGDPVNWWAAADEYWPRVGTVLACSPHRVTVRDSLGTEWALLPREVTRYQPEIPGAHAPKPLRGA